MNVFAANFPEFHLLFLVLRRCLGHPILILKGRLQKKIPKRDKMLQKLQKYEEKKFDEI